MAESVLVTGASGGLGVAVARRLLDDGWRVVATVRAAQAARAEGDGSPSREVSREPSPESAPRSFPEPVLVAADVTDEAEVTRAVQVAGAEPAAPLTAVVNLVGGFAQGGRVHETPVAQFEAQFRLNLRSAYLVTAAALPHLIAAGGGSVVCVGSRAAVRPFSGAAGYVVSKAALLALVETLAVEYRDDGVRVNSVLPSVIDTPMNRAAQPNADHSRWVRPEQIADVIAALCSGTFAATSGAHIPVYGRA